MKLRIAKFYHRDSSNIRKHDNVRKTNHFIGNHRVLDEIKTFDRPNQKILKNNENAETENKSGKESDKLSFSHRAVQLRSVHPGFIASKEREKQMEINRLTNYVIPKVHKLNPSKISQSIILRSKLAKFLPKKDLQPKLYPKSSISMQKHLSLLKPCENYKKSRNLDKFLDEQKPPTTRENLSKLKQRNMDSSRFTMVRSMENTPWSRSGFLERAMKLVNKQRGSKKEVMSPINNLVKRAKDFANAVKNK